MASDHSFDIISKIDYQELDNAIQQAKKEVDVRFDLKDSNSTIELSKTDNKVTINSSDSYKLNAVGEIFRQKLIKRNISLKSCQFEDPKTIGQNRSEQVVKLQQGISQEHAKLITKCIKDSKLKVQAQINGDKVKVTAKKIDDLQGVIQLLRSQNFDFYFSCHINS